MCLTAGLSVGEMVCRRFDGIESSRQVIRQESSKSLETSSSVRGENKESAALLAGNCRLSWSGSENWLLIAEILSVKNEANISGVSRLEVGEGGGLRTDLKAANPFLASVVPQILFC